MARSFPISRKLYDLNKKLGKSVGYAKWLSKNLDVVVRGKKVTAYTEMVRLKVEAFDMIFDLSLDEQAKLFEYREFKKRADRSIWKKYDLGQLEELARSLGHKDLFDLVGWATFERWDRTKPGLVLIKRIDTGKMVSDFLDGGQQSDDGVKLKRHLDQLLNDDFSERVEITS